MNHPLLSALAILAAYLIGAIPFGYLIALGARGIDIRTVGSGNIGATNVGRILGFRFFVLVFTLDLLKGLLPTLGLPRGLHALTGQGTATTGVLVALATILGHNFPVFLGFRGGKGVATSLGALLALDAPAALAAAAGFGVSLAISRYVSLSSILGGFVFAGVHFARVPDPWGRDRVAMSLLTVGLLALLIVRHRKNLARLYAGTEPKVSPKKRTGPPGGRVAVVVLVVIMLVACVASGLAVQASRRAELHLGTCTLIEVARASTGHQRAERVAFADHGRILAVTCPRYDRVVLYRVTSGESLEVRRDIALEGHPVAIWPVEDRLFVLQRPAGDARHVEPGYWETFDFQGNRIGSKERVGFYPDDMAITPDGRHALVLTSGSAEGGAHRPRPALSLIAIGPDANAASVVGRVEFDRPGDDPERMALSASGRRATVALFGSDHAATIDLSDPARPFVVARAQRSTIETRTPLEVLDEVFDRPLTYDGEADAVRLDLPGLGGCIARTEPRESRLGVFEARSRRPLGRFPLRGAMNMGPTRPTGVAYEAERGLIAVATRSGSVHLIAVRPGPDAAEVPRRDRGPRASARTGRVALP